MRPRSDMQFERASPNRPPLNRRSIRAQVLPTEIRGIVTAIGSGEHLPFLVWDVSHEGIGLWLSQPLTVGDKVRIAVGQPYLVVLDATVIWCDDKAQSQGFRCGFSVTQSREVLVGLYEQFGG